MSLKDRLSKIKDMAGKVPVAPFPYCLTMIGGIRAGKTTIATSIAKHPYFKDKNVLVVTFDKMAARYIRDIPRIEVSHRTSSSDGSISFDRLQDILLDLTKDEKLDLLVIDTFSNMIEEYLRLIAIRRYNANVSKDKRKDEKLADLGLIPNGRGWMYLREEIMRYFELFRSISNHLIIISHDKLLTEYDDGNPRGTERVAGIPGKAGTFVLSNSDSVVYIKREKTKAGDITTVVNENLWNIKAGSYCEWIPKEFQAIVNGRVNIQPFFNTKK